MPRQRILKNPIEIQVSTGGNSLKVKARSFREAFIVFLDTIQPKSLGIITEFIAPGYSGDIDETPDDYTYYNNTITLLKDIGRMDKNA